MILQLLTLTAASLIVWLVYRLYVEGFVRR